MMETVDFGLEWTTPSIHPSIPQRRPDYLSAAREVDPILSYPVAPARISALLYLFLRCWILDVFSILFCAYRFLIMTT